jgi:hypothetical protein
MTALATCVAVMAVYSQEHQMRADEMKVCTWHQLDCARTQHDLGKMYANSDGVKTSQQKNALVCRRNVEDHVWKSLRGALISLPLAHPLFKSLWNSAKKRKGGGAFGFRILAVLAWVLLPVLFYCLGEVARFMGWWMNSRRRAFDEALRRAGFNPDEF